MNKIKHGWQLNLLYSVVDKRMVTLQRESSIFFPVFNNMNKNWEKEVVGEDTKEKKKKTKQKITYLSSKKKHLFL